MTMNRRSFLGKTGTWLLAQGFTGLLPAETNPAARLAIVTDVHYADKATEGTRRYRDSWGKLQEAIDLWNKQSINAVIQIGDCIDNRLTKDLELEDLRRVRGAFHKLAAPQYFVLGNHCVLTLTKQDFLAQWGADASWYSFSLPGYRCIVLDSAFTSDGKPYGGRDFDWTDSCIPAHELDWLERELSATKLPVLIFVHHRLDVSDHYSVSNAVAVREILQKSSKVTAVFQGHNHVNDHQIIGGIHYCTLAAMVEGPPPASSAYGVLELFPNGSLHVQGYRLLTSLTV